MTGNIRTVHRPSVEDSLSDDKFVNTNDSGSPARKRLSKDIAAYNEAATLQNIIELEDIRKRQNELAASLARDDSPQVESPGQDIAFLGPTVNVPTAYGAMVPARSATQDERSAEP